jgi:hypothetical protein
VSALRSRQNESPPAASQPVHTASMQYGRAGSSASHSGSICPSIAHGGSPVVLSSLVPSTCIVVALLELDAASSLVLLPASDVLMPSYGEHVGGGGTGTQPLLLASQRLQYRRLG